MNHLPNSTEGIYNGTWKNGWMHGQGKLTTAAGIVLDGLWDSKACCHETWLILVVAVWIWYNENQGRQFSENGVEGPTRRTRKDR